MHTLMSRVLPVAVGAALVVGGLDLASYAANGHPFSLGAKNKETRTATLTNTGKGPALSLRSGKKAPSLAVSSSRLVIASPVRATWARAATLALAWTISTAAWA